MGFWAVSLIPRISSSHLAQVRPPEYIPSTAQSCEHGFPDTVPGAHSLARPQHPLPDTNAQTDQNYHSSEPLQRKTAAKSSGANGSENNRVLETRLKGAVMARPAPVHEEMQFVSVSGSSPPELGQNTHYGLYLVYKARNMISFIRSALPKQTRLNTKNRHGGFSSSLLFLP